MNVRSSASPRAFARHLFIVAAVLAASGCGSNTNEGSGSGGSTSGAGGGGGAGAPSCNPQASFDAPVAIAELNTKSAEGPPRLSHDELTVYFSRITPDGADDLFVATRSSPTRTFGAPTRLALDTAASEDSATPTGDGLTLFFASAPHRAVGDPAVNIFVATRANASAEFGDVAAVDGLNDPIRASVYPYVMPDGKTLYYATEIGSRGYTDLRRATGSGSSFANDDSGLLANVETDRVETSPVVTIDELTLYFLSDRDDWHVYRSTRTTMADAFGVPEPVYELDSSLTEPGWISDDGCRLYLAEDDGSGDTNIFVATKPAR